MSLVVLGGQPLDKLQHWVADLFSAVPSGKGPRPTFFDAGMPYKVCFLSLNGHLAGISSFWHLSCGIVMCASFVFVIMPHGLSYSCALHGMHYTMHNYCNYIGVYY